MNIKKYMNLLLVCSAFALLSVSCEDYLDKSPDQGIDETEVYKDYSSFSGFLDNAYKYLDLYSGFNACGNGRTHVGAISDEFASMYNGAEAKLINSGAWSGKEITAFEIGNKSGGGGTSIWKAYKGLRIVNRIIQDVNKVSSITESQEEQMLGQAYFLRSWFYFQLIKRYGGMPKFDALFLGDGSEDLPRMTYQESHAWMMEDLNMAIKYLPERWDADNVGRPDRIAALAFKSEATLYAASPLMQNDLETTVKKPYNKEACVLAAQAAQAVLTEINQNPDWGIQLRDGSDYAHIFYYLEPPYWQNEYLWANYSTTGSSSRYIRSFFLPNILAKGTGNDAVVFNAPTQNMVDLFGKQGSDGIYYPITDSRSGYDPQDPYAKRDPRFYNNILYCGEKWGNDFKGNPLYIDLYDGGGMSNVLAKNSQSNTRQQTGYMCKKFIWEGADQYKGLWNQYRHQDVYIRLAEIYLNLAEASFEATGSATNRVEGCTLSAEEAINIIRDRVGITPLAADIISDETAFRSAYRRERAVELMFEDKRWWDLRRWMIADEVFQGNYPIKGMKVTPVVKVGTDQSQWTYSYEVVDVIPEQRVFEMRNYWYPFALNDVAALNNLVQNPGW